MLVDGQEKGMNKGGGEHTGHAKRVFIMSMKDSMTALCGNAGLQAERRHDGFGEEH